MLAKTAARKLMICANEVDNVIGAQEVCNVKNQFSSLYNITNNNEMRIL